MKNNRGHSGDDSTPLGPEPAVQPTELSPAVAFVHEHLSAQAGAVTISALAAMTGLHQNTVREHLDQLVETGAATKAKAASTGRGRPAWLYRSAGSPRTGSSEYLGLASVLAAQIDRTSADPRADGIAAGLDWGRELAREVAENRAAVDTVTAPNTDTSAEAASPDAATAPTLDAAPAPTPAEETLALLDSLGFAPKPASPVETGTDSENETFDPENKGVDQHSFRLTRCPLLEAAHEYPDIVCGVHLGLVRGALEVFGDPDAESEIDPFSEPGACRLHLRESTSESRNS